MDKIEKRYLTQKEAEHYTGMGETTLSRIMKGVVIHSAYGSRRFYDKKDIDARIEALKGSGDADD